MDFFSFHMNTTYTREIDTIPLSTVHVQCIHYMYMYIMTNVPTCICTSSVRYRCKIRFLCSDVTMEYYIFQHCTHFDPSSQSLSTHNTHSVIEGREGGRYEVSLLSIQ